ncbi:MAG: hypothetical protein N2112_14650 [Gemmataceae bacterium]|nr:hypothetical protein [Gemmataceae bacterium]
MNLPSGPWPPDYFTLLELSHEETSPEEIEERVFVRMERLRKYQITHPEVVSEGMNLLAKAMDTLTDPVNRQSYLLALGIESRAAHPPDDSIPNLLPLDEPVFPDKEGDVNENPIPSNLPSELEDAEALLLEPIDLDEIDEENEAEEEEISQAIILPQLEPLVVPPPPLPRRFPQFGSVESSPPPLPKRSAPFKSEEDSFPLHLVFDRNRVQSPRQLYRERARLRRCLEAWELAYPFLAEPTRSFQRPSDRIRQHQAIEAVKNCLPDVIEFLPDTQQSLLVSLMKRPDGVNVVQTLLPSQRESLAKSFRRIHYDLTEYAFYLRQQVQRRHERDFVRTYLGPLGYMINRYPEILMFPLALLSLIIAIWRS